MTKTLVFLHGWCCSPNDFRLLTDAFKDYTLLIPDHSEMLCNMNDRKNLFDACVSQIADLIKEDVIIIGHSMGGIMALSLTQKLGARVKGCAILDSTVPRTEESKQAFKQFTSALTPETGRELLSQLFEKRMIHPEFDDKKLMEDKKEEMIKTWEKAPQKFTQQLIDASQFPSSEAVADCPCPLLYIGGTPPLGDIPALKKLKPQIQTAQVSSGHFVMLGAPKECIRLLQAMIDELIPIL